MKQTVWHQLKLCPQGDPDHTLPDAAIAVEHGTIAWLGASADLPAQYAAWPREELHGAWVTPGLVDCHTHLVYGGQRADEFAQRLAGVSYEEIARQGGGIVSTVRATRAASEDALFNQSAARLEPLLAEGLTAIEIKSGYGLDLDSERKMLRVARQLGERYPVTVYTTFLGAHALPPEFAGRADAYIDEVCNTMLPALADEGLVDAVDVFCERIGFSLEQSERVFNAAARYKLPVKMHAEQLSNGGGTALAARHRALSADHLEFLDEAGVAAMKEAGTVAVLLPGAYYFIRETQLPPLDLLRRYEVPIAISTDSNPGTSPATSLLLMMNMATTLFRMTVPEVLKGVTSNAARALGKADRHGSLEAGRAADFAVWSVDSLAELAYWIGRPLCSRVVRAGETVYAAPSRASSASSSSTRDAN
ncbi:imidazolonepropionase [Paraburkholderia sp. GV068]|jgi:imidazolonepropionase|uniref:imidazolonepropionase n=1 Tax=Paraburkholderia TaxID=1822464 RepID=UPI000D30A098|nr:MULTISPECIES: imidazolonepropionase [Paraburkholderia]AXF07622.1 imidazolonepropionase [Paraburkholderia graminis]MDR6466347.1 imidazolonepropionase [Paraburkholderia graminis]MDR6474378.1 imidazolonepropionase [Paraburkholderia graminis]PTQ98684.1 imidazolonepropionase [Paraburkholderia sp. GV072]PUB03927.1 imidazolonepropionase [Paraburkholderia sp. GV068]